jgi:hypothetical protein
VDGSVVTYSWYRFVDQPSFQQYAWSEEKKAKLQAFVVKLHAAWPIDRDYMAPPSHGKLATLDPALLVTPARRVSNSATSPSSRARPGSRSMNPQEHQRKPRRYLSDESGNVISLSTFGDECLMAPPARN